MYLDGKHSKFSNCGKLDSSKKATDASHMHINEFICNFLSTQLHGSFSFPKDVVKFLQGSSPYSLKPLPHFETDRITTGFERLEIHH